MALRISFYASHLDDLKREIDNIQLQMNLRLRRVPIPPSSKTKCSEAENKEAAKEVSINCLP